MLWHDNVSENAEAITPPHLFKPMQKEIAAAGRSKNWTAMITTGGYKAKVAGSEVAFGMSRHGRRIE
jgi:hypothetical protein